MPIVPPIPRPESAAMGLLNASEADAGVSWKGMRWEKR
jgi:hypothetical protein